MQQINTQTIPPPLPLSSHPPPHILHHTQNETETSKSEYFRSRKKRKFTCVSR